MNIITNIKNHWYNKIILFDIYSYDEGNKSTTTATHVSMMAAIVFSIGGITSILSELRLLISLHYSAHSHTIVFVWWEQFVYNFIHPYYFREILNEIVFTDAL